MNAIAGAENVTLEARAAAYLLFSRLLTSPAQRNVGLDGPAIASAVEIIAGDLPAHAWNHAALADTFAGLDAASVVVFDRAYGAIFEVAGCACAIREEHAGVAGKQKEEVVRFYDHFGYQPHAAVAWQPDHLAVELEFLYFLVEGERRAVNSATGTSYRLAQHDFCARHPGQWAQGLSGRAASAGAPQSMLTLLAGLETFLEADLFWHREHSPARTH